ncbi:MAG: hybrid sensor histidine kinase/response regulator [Phormidesmis sp.]
MVEREEEIRLQFIDEATAYLDTLETTLLGVAQRGVEIHEMNGALRAAHSIKGGAALMGYGLTSDLAHRLEDSLKVLKIQRGIGVTSDVEGQLLRGVDAIRQVLERDRRGLPPDESWVATAILPLFDGLHDTLGEPSAEDAASLMDTDEGQNVVPLIFQTEVGAVLGRLEALIDEQAANLKEEIVIMCQELSGLGEMLDLPVFVQLCESAERYALSAATSAQIQEVANQTLRFWRRARALVLTGNTESMPEEITGMSFEPSADRTASASGFTADDVVEAADLPLPEDAWNDLGTEDDALVETVFSGLEDSDEAADSDQTEESETATEDAFADVFERAGSEKIDGSSVARRDLGGTEFRFSELPEPHAETADLSDNTVRVSVRKLKELNNHFGELTIERNRLEAEVKQMRRLAKNLSQQLRSLDEISDTVKELYEPSENRRLPIAMGSLIGSDPVPPPKTESPGDLSHCPNFDRLEFSRYSEVHLSFRQMAESVVKLREVAGDIELSVDKTEQTTRVLHRTSRRLQRTLNHLRMRPFSDITNRFPRALRALELTHGKSVALQLDGENTLIDRNILEALSDPLMHIVRNAFDHGIETPQRRQAQGKSNAGVIAIHAANRGNRTVITVSDDGKGIDLEKIRSHACSMGLDTDLLNAASEADLLSLIFEPGFSTSKEVTALSGRGVGMDVVRNNLTQIRGDITVGTQVGKGTTFTISVPYTLSITRVILAEGNRMLVAVPTDSIEEVVILEPGNFYQQEGREMFHFGGDAIRLIRLSNWLAFNCPRQVGGLNEPPRIDSPSIIIFRMGEQRMGLQIDRSWGEQESAVRPVEGPIALPPGFSNCTILGDGRVVPLINLPDLARWVASCEGSEINSAAALYSNSAMNDALAALSWPGMLDQRVRRHARFLVIDDSVNVRRLLSLLLEKAGYAVEQAEDGQAALEKLEAGLEVDSIVCDVEMPQMDGYGFLTRLRSLPTHKNTPVTLLTSRSGDKPRQLAMDLGATAYFSKPYQERALLESLAASLKETGGEKGS